MYSRKIKISESVVESETCDYARRRGWHNRKVKWIGRHSAPDRYFTKKGQIPFFVEFKRPGGKLRKSQEEEVKRLNENGTIVYVIDNIEDGRSLFS